MWFPTYKAFATLDIVNIFFRRIISVKFTFTIFPSFDVFVFKFLEIKSNSFKSNMTYR